MACIHGAFEQRSSQRRLCPLCRSKQKHRPIRIPALEAVLQTTHTALSADEQTQYRQRMDAALVTSSSVRPTFTSCFGHASMPLCSALQQALVTALSHLFGISSRCRCKRV